MKNISSKLIGAIVTMHLVLAYITGLRVEPFESAPWYVWAVIPVVILLGIGVRGLDPVFKNYKYHSLGVKLRFTATTPWVWVLLILSTLAVVGMVWYGGQMLKPVTEISQRIIFDGDAKIGNMLCLSVCSVLYVACMIWLYKTLKKVWQK